MGRRKRSLIKGPSLFFVTFSTYERIYVFNSDELLEIVESTLFEVVKSYEHTLLGYVIMPNHLHLLLGVNNNGNELSKFIFSLKGMIRKRIYGDKALWQKRFDDLVINTEKQFKVKLDYIHNNPVKRGLVEYPAEWKFSSYLFWIGDRFHPVLKEEFKYD